MELEPAIGPVDINGETFDIIKPTRLLPGMVLKSRSREAYARLGLKQSALEEQIHTASLRERGFPVAQILDSGPRGTDEWFFIEESLGDKTFHAQFSEQYAANGSVSDETFAQYLQVLDAYTTAQYDPANRTSISAQEFIQNAIPNERIIANYQLCGGDIERYHEAITRATDSLADSPMGVLQLDLNPFNVLEHGVIDFELVGYGPLGYDSSLVSLWHRWFTSDRSSRYRITYRLTDEQIAAAQTIVTEKAQIADVIDPRKYIEEFLLIKTAWGFNSEKSIHDEPESKQLFYQYRAALLSEAVEAYLANDPIPVLEFPDVRALPDGAAATHSIPPRQ